jgi:hypothetical protein
MWSADDDVNAPEIIGRIRLHYDFMKSANPTSRYAEQQATEQLRTTQNNAENVVLGGRICRA